MLAHTSWRQKLPPPHPLTFYSTWCFAESPSKSSSTLIPQVVPSKLCHSYSGCQVSARRTAIYRETWLGGWLLCW